MIVVATLTAAALAASAYGTKKGVDAYSDNQKANRINKNTKYEYEKWQTRLDNVRKKTNTALEELGARKLKAWDDQIGKFVELFEQLRNVQLDDVPEIDTLDMQPPDREALSKMKQMSLQASDMLAGGLGAISSGALVGLASYGGATALASASTGTAIASLSGAAAKSATLAWFGGGAVGAGGLGMAGGMAVLGGIVAGPVLAVGGMVFAAKAREKLAEAKKQQAKAKEAIEQIKLARSIAQGIHKAAEQHTDFIDRFAMQMDRSLGALDAVIQCGGTDYMTMKEEEQRIVHVAVQFAQVMKLALTTPLLNEDGSLTSEEGHVLEVGQKFLGSRELA